MKREDFPFWTFSLDVYGRSGVAELCLALQDERGLDVNLLLFGLWLGGQGRTVDAAEMTGLVDAARPWQEGVVKPLRQARRALKAMASEDLRKTVAEAELDAEYREQRRLAEAARVLPAAVPTDPDEACRNNLKVYLNHQGQAWDERLTILLEIIRRR